MTRGFKWTATRDKLLLDLRRGGLSLKETARAIGAGCDVEHARLRLGELNGSLYVARAKPAAGDVASVPRPVGVARRDTVSAAAGASPPGRTDGRREPAEREPARCDAGSQVSHPARRRPTLIDLSRAPSSMEQAAQRWGGR